MIPANTYKKFSIITVTNNCATTIARTIESVLSQNRNLFEYIVIDGASTDGTKEAIEEYIEYIDYFISEPDNGIYDAMNKALGVALGNMILFLNGDDYFADDTVLDKVSEEYVDDHTILIGRIMFGDKPSPNMAGVKINSKYYGVLYPHQATFVPREVYETLGRFDEKYPVAADFEFICRAMYQGYRIKWIDTMVSFYTLGGKSSTLQGRIDEYLISKKYMILTNDKFIDGMRSVMVNYMTSSLLDMACHENDTERYRRVLIDAHIGSDSAVQIWGAGYWGERLLNLIRKCDIGVSCVFDSNKDGIFLQSIPVTAFNKKKVSKIIISTEQYGEEIENFLREQGFVKGQDYISFSDIKNLLLNAFDKNSDVYQNLLKQTGLDVIA